MSVRQKSGKRGTSTSVPEVTNVSKHGFWMLVDGSEHFLSFAEFPWFENATIKELHSVSRPARNHLRWDKLDIDLALDSITDPARYPLIARDRPKAAKAKQSPPKRKDRAASPRKATRRST